jgi:hypothetical protein
MAKNASRAPGLKSAATTLLFVHVLCASRQAADLSTATTATTTAATAVTATAIRYTCNYSELGSPRVGVFTGAATAAANAPGANARTVTFSYNRPDSNHPSWITAKRRITLTCDLQIFHSSLWTKFTDFSRNFSEKIDHIFHSSPRAKAVTFFLLSRQR